MPLLAGSILYDLHEKKISLFNKSFQLKEPLSFNKQENNYKVIPKIARQFINTPYLWGGRSSFGIDCSGFVQTVYKIAGIKLPRDAAQQAKQGIFVSSLDETLPGDVAFFENEDGNIVHTGILLSKKEIIHASGKVHIASIDEKGIFNQEKQLYTHKLAVIKRMV